MHAHPLNSCISKPRSYVYCFVISSSASSHTAAWEHDIGVGGGGGRSVSQAHLVQVPLLPETLRPHPADGTGWAEAGGQVGLSAYKSLLTTAFPFMTFFILKGQFTPKSVVLFIHVNSFLEIPTIEIFAFSEYIGTGRHSACGAPSAKTHILWNQQDVSFLKSWLMDLVFGSLMHKTFTIHSLLNWAVTSRVCGNVTLLWPCSLNSSYCEVFVCWILRSDFGCQ